jgi:hypothetical protein
VLFADGVEEEAPSTGASDTVIIRQLRERVNGSGCVSRLGGPKERKLCRDMAGYIEIQTPSPRGRPTVSS